MIGAALWLLAMQAAGQPEEVPAIPQGNPATWLSTDDYPPTADHYRESGLTQYKLAVNADGTVASCLIVASSGSEELDATTCRLLTERGRFRPIKPDPKHPIRRYYSGRVNWHLPSDSELPDPETLIRTMIIERDATVTNCLYRYVHPSEPAQPQWRVMTCPTPVFPQPYRDANGKPIRKRLTYTLTTAVEDVP